MRKMMIAAAFATAAVGAPALAQQQGGLVNVNVSDIEVELEEILSNNTTQVNVPVVVSIPVGIAANICPDVNVAALLAAAGSGTDPVCNADADATSDGEANAVANIIKRQTTSTAR